MIMMVMIFYLYYYYFHFHDSEAPGDDGDNSDGKKDEIDDVSEVEYGDDYDDDGDDRDVIIMDSHCLPRGSCERNELLPTHTIIKTQQWMRLPKYFGIMNTSPIDNLLSEDIIRLRNSIEQSHLQNSEENLLVNAITAIFYEHHRRHVCTNSIVIRIFIILVTIVSTNTILVTIISTIIIKTTIFSAITIIATIVSVILVIFCEC